MTTQINRARLHVDVHQVVDDPTLDVVLNAIDQESATDVNHFDERQISEKKRGKVVKPVILKIQSQRQRKCVCFGKCTCHTGQGQVADSSLCNIRFFS